MNYNNLISSSTTSSNTAASCDSATTTASPDSYSQQQKQILFNFTPTIVPQTTSTFENVNSNKISSMKTGPQQAPILSHPPQLQNHSTPTAYLVQTSDGNTILIQPNSTHQFAQLSQQQQNNQNTLLSNHSNNYNLTIPIQYIQQQQQQLQTQYQQPINTLYAHNMLPASSSNAFERPDSTISNVYQTIDADK